MLLLKEFTFHLVGTMACTRMHAIAIYGHGSFDSGGNIPSSIGASGGVSDRVAHTLRQVGGV
jgi:hypothetical protein